MAPGRRTALLAAVLAVTVGLPAAASRPRDTPVVAAVSDAGLPPPASRAITHPPREAWSIASTSNFPGFLDVGRAVVVADGLQVLSVSSTGRVRWRTPVPDLMDQVHPLAGRSDLVALEGINGGAAVVSVDTGRLRWSTAPRAGYFADAFARRVYLEGGDGLVAMDAATGARQWSARGGDAVDELGTTAYVAGAGRVEARSARTGKLRWSATTASDEFALDVVATPAQVVVADGYGLVSAFDPASGRALWSLRSTSEDVPATVTAYTGGRVLVARTGSLTIVDAAGGTTEAAVDPSPATSTPYAEPVACGGRQYVVDVTNRRVLDDVGRLLRDFGGGPTSELEPTTTGFHVVDCGFYLVSGLDVQFFPVGADRPAWRLRLGRRGYDATEILPGDRSLYVVFEKTITAYR